MFRMKVCCEIEAITLSKEAHFFIIVQMKNNHSQESVKFRTETSCLTNRPQFKKNLFTFTLTQHLYTLKLALMSAKSQLDHHATNAMVHGVSSINISTDQLKEQKNNKYQEQLHFSDRGKDVGQFTLKISLKAVTNQEGESKQTNFFMSRVLYNQDCQDTVRIENNIKILEQKLVELHEMYTKTKKEQNYLEKVYEDLEKDQLELKMDIDSTENLNSKIQHKLEAKENLQNLKLQISMLEQSEGGKKLLIEKLEYFQDRIYRQIQENQKLALQYKKIKPVIERNLQKAQQHAQKLKGKQLQEFQLQNNEKILRNFDDLVYQFKCNEQTIQSFMKMSKESDLTAQQAKFLLSQVSYEVKLSEFQNLQDEKQKQMLEQIEKQAEFHNEQTPTKLSEQEQMIYKIKLSALERQIQQTRTKIQKLNKNSS